MRTDCQPSDGKYNLINVAGTMTPLGSCSVGQSVVQQMAHVLPRFVRLLDLQADACAAIQAATGAEAGIVTGCAAAGVAVSVAACMTGFDAAKAEQLPETTGLKKEVIIQRGHCVHYGGRLDQAIRFTGADVVEIGDVNRAGVYQLKAALSEMTAASVYAVSHHTVHYGQLGLREFCVTNHERGVPVIVDAASESKMTMFVEEGADLVCFSGHKFLGGPTSGIIAGRADLIAACMVNQTMGIGRLMKVGKEGIVGVTAALREWIGRDPREERARQAAVLAVWRDGLAGCRGISTEVVPDPTGNPVDRLRVIARRDETRVSAQDLVASLAAGAPPIYVRDHHAHDEGYFELDPCSVTDAEARQVALAIRELLAKASPPELRGADLPRQHAARADAQVAALSAWAKECCGVQSVDCGTRTRTAVDAEHRTRNVVAYRDLSGTEGVG